MFFIVSGSFFLRPVCGAVPVWAPESSSGFNARKKCAITGKDKSNKIVLRHLSVTSVNP